MARLQSRLLVLLSVALLLVCGSPWSPFAPGQPAKPLKLQLLDGSFISYPSPRFLNSSLVFTVYNSRSAFLEVLMTDNYSASNLVANITENRFFLFLDNVGNKSNVEWMASLFPPNDHLLFVTTDPRDTWIGLITAYYHCVDHNCGLDYLEMCGGDGHCVDTRRLDGRYDWLPGPYLSFGSRPQPVSVVSDPCSAPIAGIEGRVALVELASPAHNCSRVEMLALVEASGGSGLLLLLGLDQPMFEFSCDQCEAQGLYFGIPASVVGPSEAIKQMAEAGNATASFLNRQSPNFFFAIDKSGLYQEMGWLLYPDFDFHIWLAQSFEYQLELERSLQLAAEHSLQIQVFDNQVMEGDSGAQAVVEMPAVEGRFNRLLLNFSMSCPGATDADCGQWDHTTQLFVCCQGDAAAAAGSLCGSELGRWITAFRRRTGHWLTDVTPMLRLLSQGTCTFTAKHAPWAMPWLDSLTLILSRHPTDGRPAPSEPLFLWEGGTFDSSYNTIHSPLTFTAPTNYTLVQISALITGHGSDNNGCGEFCPTTHVFEVDGKTNYSVTFDQAGTALGCTRMVRQGAVPNEHGTWLYGRDGWCDGLDVKPVLFDISNSVRPGRRFTLQYWGLFNGTTPNPTRDPGYIIMSSYLVYFN